MLCMTLPHAHCHRGKDRFEQICDISSEETAYRLSYIFETLNIPNVIVTSKQNRSVMDDNRKESELSSPLHRTVKRNLDKTLCILDIHSFYKNAFRLFPEIKQLDGHDPDDSALVIFTTGNDSCNDSLYYYLKKRNPDIPIALMLTPDLVFILKHYIEKHRVPTYMFEFAEFRPIPQELLESIGMYFKNHVFDLYQYFKQSKI